MIPKFIALYVYYIYLLSDTKSICAKIVFTDYFVSYEARLRINNSQLLQLSELSEWKFLLIFFIKW